MCLVSNFVLFLSLFSLTSCDIFSDLSAGGYVVYFRHTIATTCDDTSGRYLGYANTTDSPDWWMSCFPNCTVDDCTTIGTRCDGAVCRQIDTAGIQLASDIGDSISQATSIKWEKVYSGEFCRLRYTAKLLFKNFEPIPLPALTDWVYSNQFDRCVATIALLNSEIPPDGTNIAIIGDGRLARNPFTPKDPEYDICTSISALHQVHFFVYDPVQQTIIYDDIFAKVFDNFVPVIFDYIHWTDIAGIAIAAVVSLCILLNVIAIGLTAYSTQMSVIARASPLFLYIILVGTLLSYVSIYFMIGEPSSLNCIAQIWFVFVGFAISFGAIVAKNWRIWKLYYGDLTSKIVLTDIDLLKYLGIVWGIIIVVLVIWTVFMPPAPTVFGDVKICSGSPIFFAISCGYVGVISLFGVVIAIKTRSLPEEFREAKWIGLGTYNLTILALLTVPVSFAIQRIFLSTAFVILSMGIILWTSGIWMFLLLPKFYLIFVKGEKEVVFKPSSHNTAMTPNSFNQDTSLQSRN